MKWLAKLDAFLQTILQDFQYGSRSLRASPTFAFAAIITLALGIGVNTAVFSVVNAVLLRPLPVRGGDRLVVIATQRASNPALGAVSFADLQDYRTGSADIFEDVAGYSAGFLGLAHAGGEPERVLVTWVTGNYFSLLGVQPALGRLIRPDEGAPGRTDPVVILGYSTWERRFGGDPTAVGSTVRVNGVRCTIVGVTPQGFAGTFAFSESELYLPLNWQAPGGFDNRHLHGLHALARLRAGVTIERAQTVMNVIAERLAGRYPDSNADLGVRLLPERLARPEEDQFRTNRVGAAVMLAMVLLVLIIAAVNVTNLLLARTAIRQREFAIRFSLGAGRARIIRQVVTECLLLVGLGGVAGLLAGTWAARALATMRLPGDLPVRFDFRLDVRVLAYTALAVLVTGLLVGVSSALRVSRPDLERTLRGSQEGTTGARRYRMRGALVVAQLACCFVLLSVAGLLARSLFEAEHADLGFRPEGVLNVQMDVGQLGYTEAQGRAFFGEVDRRIRSIPGVERASFAFTVPMGYIRVTTAVEPEGRPTARKNAVFAGKNAVGAEYFRTLDIRIVRGRGFRDADAGHSRRVAIVNQRFAQVLWPGQDPIGRRFRSPESNGQWIEVVGVVSTGKYQFLFEGPQPHFYVPLSQEYTALRVLHVRASLPPESVAPAVQRAIRALEPDLPLYDVQSMARALGSGPGFFLVRVSAIAVAVFALLAFVLAVVGLYGVISYLTSQRTHEVGVRIAVGATRRQIVRLVLREGLTFVGLGLGAGVLMTVAASRIVGSFLFGVSARDPLTLSTVLAVLGAAALIACAVPAARAARLDPAAALRAE